MRQPTIASPVVIASWSKGSASAYSSISSGVYTRYRVPTRGLRWLSQKSPRRWNGSSVIWTITSSSSVSGPTCPRARSPTIQAAMAPNGGASSANRRASAASNWRRCSANPNIIGTLHVVEERVVLLGPDVGLGQDVRFLLVHLDPVAAEVRDVQQVAVYSHRHRATEPLLDLQGRHLTPAQHLRVCQDVLPAAPRDRGVADEL